MPPKPTRRGVITITPDNPNKQMDIQLGGCTNLEMLDSINALVKHFAKSTTEDYVKSTGDKSFDPDNFDTWCNKQRK